MASQAHTTATAPTEPSECIDVKVRRLARELAESLNWYSGGSLSLHIYPSEATPRSITYAQDVEPTSRRFH